MNVENAFEQTGSLVTQFVVCPALCTSAFGLYLCYICASFTSCQHGVAVFPVSYADGTSAGSVGDRHISSERVVC